jgi:hypothetical protein
MEDKSIPLNYADQVQCEEIYPDNMPYDGSMYSQNQTMPVGPSNGQFNQYGANPCYCQGYYLTGQSQLTSSSNYQMTADPSNGQFNQNRANPCYCQSYYPTRQSQSQLAGPSNGQFNQNRANPFYCQMTAGPSNGQFTQLSQPISQYSSTNAMPNQPPFQSTNQSQGCYLYEQPRQSYNYMTSTQSVPEFDHIENESSASEDL